MHTVILYSTLRHARFSLHIRVKASVCCVQGFDLFYSNAGTFSARTVMDALMYGIPLTVVRVGQIADAVGAPPRLHLFQV